MSLSRVVDGRFVLEEEKEPFVAWPRGCEVGCRLEHGQAWRRLVDTRGVTAYGWGV